MNYTSASIQSTYQTIPHLETGSFLFDGTGSAIILLNITASNAISASYAPSIGGGGTTLVTASTYPITSSWAVNSNTASYVVNATSASYVSGSMGLINTLSGSTHYLNISNFSSSVQDAIVLVNTSNATASIQQNSPAIKLMGNAWDADDLVSKNVGYRIYANPTQGNTVHSNLQIDLVRSGSADSNVISISDSSGLVSIADVLAGNNSTSRLGWSGRSMITCPVNGTFLFTNNAQSGLAILSASIAYLSSSAILTNSTPAVDIQQTWSGSTTGSSFTAIKANITDTQSNSGSLLLDLQTASVSKFSVNKTGDLLMASPTAKITLGALPTSNQGAITANPGVVTFGRGDAVRYVSIGSVGGTTAGLYMASDCPIYWSSGTTSWLGTYDTILLRDASNTLALRNTGSYQTFRVYNSFTNASSFSRVSHTGNQIKWETSGSGNLRVTSSLPVIDAQQEWSGSTNTFTGIKFNATDTTSTTSSLLLDLQKNSTSSFSVDKTGLITVGSASYALTSSYSNATTFSGSNVVTTNITASNVGIVSSSVAPTIGSVALSGGTATVLTSQATNNALIFLTGQDGGVGNVGDIYVSSRSASYSFTITSTNLLNAQTVAWWIVNPI